MKRQNWLLLLGVIALSAGPLLWIRPPVDGEEIFAGSDQQAGQAITAARPGYAPWFAPLWEPPSGEIESLLFGLQAAIGAAAIGYCLGYYRGRKTPRQDDAAPR